MIFSNPFLINTQLNLRKAEKKNMTQIEKIWSDVQNLIKPNMTSLSYHAWIEQITPLTIQDNILILEIPSPEIKKTLEDFYFEMIYKAARDSGHAISDIRLILPEDRNEYSIADSSEPVNVYALNPKYTFETFVVGSSNHFAHAAALAVANNPGTSYNPLFIYGGVGLGKTHLMHAIGQSVRSSNPASRVMYVTSETFTNELITAIQMDKRLEFRKKYRNVDVLLIDDVQFIAKKQSVQEEFFNTFNTLHNAGKQIIISSDRPPKEIDNLEERLCSRFEWGLIADIQPPDIETRIAILRNKAIQDHLEVPDDILTFIAEHVVSNIRELEGSLTRVVAYSNLRRKILNLDIAKEALKDLIPNLEEREITPELIKETVADYYSISPESLMSERRDREVVLPRQVAMYLCHSMLGYPYKKIANVFEKNDHTTAINACKKVEDLLSSDKSFSSSLEDIQKRLR